MRRVLVAVCLLAAACGGSATSPSETTAQVAGVWRATARLNNVSGGECVGPLLSTGNTSTATIQISQAGPNLNATVTDTSTGATSRYSGTVGANTLTLNWQSCDLCVVRVQCPNGAIRDVSIQTDSITATVNGSTASGTEAETYNVLSATSGANVGLLVLNSSFTATKQ
jgi:hypothetical protein